MNERVKKVTTFVKDKWTGFSTAVKVVIIAAPVAVIAIIIILAVLLNHKEEAVLYSGLNSAEATEITAAIVNMGVTDVKMTADGSIVVPETEVDNLRMRLAVEGYPKSSLNYDIWNNGVNLWSTDTDKRETMRIQLQERISATLWQLDSVVSATTNLSIPKTRDYVITPTAEEPTCSVVLKLKSDEELTNAEVRAIFRIIEKSVEGLTINNISVTDTLGRSYQWISEEEERSGLKDESGTLIARKRLQFQKEMQSMLMNNMEHMLTSIYGKGNYAINVTALLNYDNKRVESTEYKPDEGTHAGVIDHEQHIETNIDMDNAHGVIGVTANGDTSPDYPTYEGLEDGEEYYYKKDEIQYDVTNIKTLIEKDGYSIDKVSVGVAINTTNLTEGERAMIEEFVADAAGTTVDYVSVYNTSFALTSNGGSTVGGEGFGGIITRPIDTFRNTLLIVVIALGVILILLLIASLFVSKSRKKKIRTRQEMALAAAQASVGGGGDYGFPTSASEAPQEVDFNIASLTEEAGKDSRETILKREIAEFAKTNPDIVASIIKNMLRDDV